MSAFTPGVRLSMAMIERPNRLYHIQGRETHIGSRLASRNMIHHCPMQNTTQMEKILGAKLEYVNSIAMRDGRGGGKAAAGGRPTSPGETVELPDLRTKNLLLMNVQGVPLSVRERGTTLKTCTKLVTLVWHNTNLLQIQSLEKNTALTMLDVTNSRLVQIPSLEKNTALVTLLLSDNRLVQIPSLEMNTRLNTLSLSNNSLTSSSFWSSLGPALTSLTVLSAAHNRLDGRTDCTIFRAGRHTLRILACVRCESTLSRTLNPNRSSFTYWLLEHMHSHARLYV